MSYIKSSLMPGEEIVHMGRVHPLVYGWPIIWTLLVFYLPTLREVPENAAPEVTQGTAGLFGIGMAVLIFLMVTSWLRALALHLGTEYGVTNKRVVLKRGLIMRKTAEMMVSKVEGLGVEQTIPGRIFGYGTIVIGGTGGGASGFPFCANPVEFRRQVAIQADKQQAKATA